MSPGTIALDSEHPPIQHGHFPTSPCRVPQTVPRQTENREYLNKQINILRQSEFPGNEQGIIHLDQVTRRSIEAFVEHEQDRGLKAKTVSVRLMVVHAFLRFLVDGEVIDP